MSIPSWARVGAKVVCVDTSDRPASQDVHRLLTVGATYTIRATQWEHEWVAAPAGPGIFLAEVVRPFGGLTKREMPWGLWRFKPLITRTQADDIELFRPLLNPSLDELADAVRKQGEEIDAQLERLADNPMQVTT